MLAVGSGRGGVRLSLLVVLALVGGLLAFGTLAQGAVTPGTNGLIVVDTGAGAGSTLTLIDPVVNARTTIPNSTPADANPAWNPAGTSIVFDDSQAGAPAGQIATTTTNGVRSVIVTAAGNADPEFSADGNTIVYECGAGLCNTPTATGPVTVLNGSVAGDFDPDYSPDGQFVVFQTGAAGITRLNANGTGGRTVLTGTLAGDTSPRVAADNSKVFFDRGAGIFWLPWPNGGAATQVTGTIAGDIDPAPAPAGDQVAYDGGPGIQRIPQAGGAPTGVGGPTAGDLTPSWGKTQTTGPTPTPVVGTPTPTPVPPTGTISGTVFKVSRSGRTRGLRRAVVSAGAASAVTSRSGAYSITNVPGGTTVTAAARRKTCHADSVAGPLSKTTTGGNQTIDWFCVR